MGTRRLASRSWRRDAVQFPRRLDRDRAASWSSSRGSAVDFHWWGERPAGSCSNCVPCSVPARSRSAFWDDVPWNEDRRIDPRSRWLRSRLAKIRTSADSRCPAWTQASTPNPPKRIPIQARVSAASNSTYSPLHSYFVSTRQTIYRSLIFQ
jgi:hypothetical protein